MNSVSLGRFRAALRRMLSVLAVALVFGVFGSCGGGGSAQQPVGTRPIVPPPLASVDPAVPGEIVVRTNMPLDALKKALAYYPVSAVLETLPGLYTVRSSSDLATLAHDVSGIENVLWAGRVYRYYPQTAQTPGGSAKRPSYLPNDPYYIDGQLDTSTTPPTLIPYQKTTLEPISVEGAWDFTKGEGVKIGVMGSGIFQGHPEFAGQISTLSKWFFYNSGTGQVQQLGDITDVSSPAPGANGTYLAGIMSALQDNDYGFTGVAPHAPLVVLKVGHLDNTQIPPTWVIDDREVAAALNYAADNGVKVVELGIATNTGGVVGQAVKDGIDYAAGKGVVIVEPAGDAATPVDAGQISPAAYHQPNCIVVGALGIPPVGRLITSNYNITGSVVDVGAPGQGVVTTDVRPENPSGTPPTTGFIYMTSTLAASAIVAGEAALVVSALLPGQASTDTVKSLITGGADSWASLGVPDQLLGAGRVNVTRSVVNAVKRSYPAPQVQLSIQTSPADIRLATTNSNFFVGPVISGGLPPYQFRVDWGDGTATPTGGGYQAFDPGDPQVSHQYPTPRTVTIGVRVMDAGGTQNESYIVVTFKNPLAAQVSFAQEGTGPPYIMDFHAAISNFDTTTLTYDWDFGDLSPHSSRQNPQHEYAATGTYKVVFRVQDSRVPVFRQVLVHVS
jgi:hypothetical protein